MKRFYSLVCLLLVPGVMLAVGTGKIRGKVTDKESKEALVGATVSLVGTSLGAATDVDGNYVVLNVPTGTYTLKASYVGYQTITITDVRVNADLTTDQNFELPGEGVTVPTIEIRAERPLVNKNATNSVRIIDNEFFANLPGRGVEAAVALQPGVVQIGNDVYIRGGRLDETGYQLEGVGINNVLYGGKAVTFASDAVEQVQVQAGGYSAQYGNANAGIVQSELKTGGYDKWHAGLLVETDKIASQGNKTLGTYSYGYSNYDVTLSGPLSGKTLRFYGTMDNTFYRNAEIDPISGTPTPRVWDGLDFTGSHALISSNAPSYLHPTTSAVDTLNIDYPAGDRLAGSSNRYSYAGTLLLDVAPLQLKAAGSYSDQTARDPVDITNFLNQARTPEHLLRDASANLKGTYAFDQKNYVEVGLRYYYNSNVTRDPLMQDNFNLYGDSLANAQLGYTFLHESEPIPAYSIFGGGTYPNGPGVSINQPGTPVSGYNKIVQSGFGGRADVTSQAGVHELKFGGEYTRYTIRRFNPATIGRAEILRDYSGAQQENLLRQLNPGVDNYGYDVYGNEIDNDVTVNGNIVDFGARHPVFAAGYVEDKVEFSDLTLRVGLRYDHINSDSWDFIDPTHLLFVDSLKIISSSSLQKTPNTDQISPRIGFSFPVTERTIFHAQYGKFIQQSRLRDAYLGMGAIYHNVAGGNFNQNVSGYGLLPERTTGYEMGFQQQFSDLASFDITAFYKDIRDEIQYTQILPGGGSTQKAYPAYINGDFETSQGIEFAFTLRRTHRVQAQLNYTFQDARTTGSNPGQLAGAVVASQGGPFIPHYINPADFNQAHRGNLAIDYRFGADDGGPIFERFGVNLLMQFNSGHPYTLLQIPDPDVTDPRFRTPIEEIGSSTTPWFFELDAKIDKTVSFGNINANFYIYAQNILGTNNATDVYPRTGDPQNDGWLSTPNGLAALQSNGPEYAYFYNALFNSPNANNFGIPRMVRFGVKLDY